MLDPAREAREPLPPVAGARRPPRRPSWSTTVHLEALSDKCVQVDVSALRPDKVAAGSSVPAGGVSGVSVTWARCARSQWPAIEIFGSSSGMSANRSFDLRS